MTNEDKRRYLKKKYNEIWSSNFLNTIELKSEFLRFFDTDKSELINSEDWFENLWHKTENHHILRYLSTNDGIYICFKEFIDKWVEFGRIKHITLFCRNQIELLENNETIKFPKASSNRHLKNTTQKVYLFNEILNYKYWTDLSENKKAEILSEILDVHKDTVRNSLAVLDESKVKSKQSLKKDIENVKGFFMNLGVNMGDPND